jgi:hypothetical protein
MLPLAPVPMTKYSPKLIKRTKMFTVTLQWLFLVTSKPNFHEFHRWIIPVRGQSFLVTLSYKKEQKLERGLNQLNYYLID